jgi:hypothetical protein
LAFADGGGPRRSRLICELDTFTIDQANKYPQIQILKRAEEIGMNLKGKNAALEDACKNVLHNRRDTKTRFARKGLP